MEIVKEKLVTKKDTALSIGSGSLEVLSTAELLAFVENSCFLELEKHMKEGYTTVGTMANFTHLKATPVGMKIKVVANLLEKVDKKYVFDFVVYDEIDLISKGTHERYIVNIDKFMERTYKKLEDAKQ